MEVMLVGATSKDAEQFLIWLGDKNTDILELQRRLNRDGLTLAEVRVDKWAVVKKISKE